MKKISVIPMKMGIHYLVLLLLLLCTRNHLHAQKEDYNWIFGSQGETAKNLFHWDDDKNLHIDSAITEANFFRYNSAISDSLGILILYTNGLRIYDGQTHQVITNGDSINYGWYWDLYYPFNDHNSPNSSFFLKDIKEKGIYHLFHLWVDTVYSVSAGGSITKSLAQTTIAKENGEYKVIEKNKEILIDTLSAGGFSACRHANGRDWWLVCHEVVSSCLYVLLYNPTGIELQNKYCLGDTAWTWGASYATFSPDGSAFVYANPGQQGIKILNFDRCSGVLSFREQIPRIDFMAHSDPFTHYLGHSIISPNSRYLISGPSDSTFRFDLNSNNISDSKTLIAWAHPDSANIYGFVPTAIHEDGKLYSHAATFKNYSVMHNPDECNSIENCDIDYFEPLPKKGSPSFGNFPNYRLGRLIGSPCDTLHNDTTGINELTKLNVLEAYPNPAHTKIRIDYAGKFWEQVSDLHLKITNILGQEYYNKKLPEYSARQTIDLKNYASGIYFVYLVDEGKVLGSIKFVKK